MTIAVGDLIAEYTRRPAAGLAELPVLTLTEHNGFMLQSERFHKRLATTDTAKYKVVGRGDIAFNPYLLWAGAVAQNTIVNEGIISPLYPTFRVRDGYDPRYVGRLLLSPHIVTMYDAIAFGSVPRRRRSSVDDFLELELPVTPPQLSEQRRIAAILDQVDAVRAKRRQVIAHLDALGESIFNDMFAGEQRTARVEDIGIDIRTGPFGSQLLHSEFVPEGIAVLGLDNVVENEFQWSQRRYITQAKYEGLRRYTVRGGDVLISIMGTTGRCVVVPDGIGTAINTKHICAITVDHAQVAPEFLRASFLWAPQSRAHLRRQTKGSIMDGLNMGIIKAMPVPLPPLARQREFVRKLASVANQRVACTRELEAEGSLFASLQSRAFRGEL